MICPHCRFEGSSDKIIPARAYYNVTGYNKAAVATSLCCKKPLGVVPVMAVKLVGLERGPGEDDWGVPYNEEII